MMGPIQKAKSLASMAARYFAPTVVWQRDLKAKYGVSFSVQTRERSIVGLRLLVPNLDLNYTALLTAEEALNLSRYLAEASLEIGNSGTKQEDRLT
jgi:hypothetical protein